MRQISLTVFIVIVALGISWALYPHSLFAAGILVGFAIQLVLDLAIDLWLGPRIGA